MKEQKPNPGGRWASDPDNLLNEHVNFRLSRAMLDAINQWRGSRAVGVAIRELIAWALERKSK